MQGQMERKIRNLLDNIEVADNVPPQPARSTASLDEDKKYDNLKNVEHFVINCQIF